MNKVSTESMLARMKTNHSSFELIPEEGEESMQDNTVTSVSASLKQKLSEPCVTTTTTCGTNAIPVLVNIPRHRRVHMATRMRRMLS